MMRYGKNVKDSPNCFGWWWLYESDVPDAGSKVARTTKASKDGPPSKWLNPK